VNSPPQGIAVHGIVIEEDFLLLYLNVYLNVSGTGSVNAFVEVWSCRSSWSHAFDVSSPTAWV
jgi:hypothetical protein